MVIDGSLPLQGLFHVQISDSRWEHNKVSDMGHSWSRKGKPWSILLLPQNKPPLPPPPSLSLSLSLSLFQYRSLLPMYYRNAAAAIVVYDITSEATFDVLQEWITELHRLGPQNIVLAIAGNKCDLEDKREVRADTTNTSGYVAVKQRELTLTCQKHSVFSTRSNYYIPLRSLWLCTALSGQVECLPGQLQVSLFLRMPSVFYARSYIQLLQYYACVVYVVSGMG